MVNLGKVAVLMGGKAAEREVSLRSGQAVTIALQSQGVDAPALELKPLADIQTVAQHHARAFIAMHGQ